MVAIVSGAEGARTPDLSVANAALSQLSYGPMFTENMGATGWTSSILRESPVAHLFKLHGRDRIRTCDLYDVNVAL